MPFIPTDKMRKLMEDSKNGDDRAKKILRAYMDRKDLGTDLDDYFAPKEEPAENAEIQAQEPAIEAKATTGNAKLDKFLADNGIKEGDPDYNDALNDYYNEFPEEMPEGGIPTQEKAEEEEKPVAMKEISAFGDLTIGVMEAIAKCDGAIIHLMGSDDIEEASKKGAISTINEAKQDLFDFIEKINKIKIFFDKGEEQEGGNIE